MHFYGGGYSDIKATPNSWRDAFIYIQNNNDMVINGYREFASGYIAYSPVSDRYNELIGNCVYIVKPRTQFTTEWYYTFLHSKRRPFRVGIYSEAVNVIR